MNLVKFVDDFFSEEDSDIDMKMVILVVFDKKVLKLFFFLDDSDFSDDEMEVDLKFVIKVV